MFLFSLDWVFRLNCLPTIYCNLTSLIRLHPENPTDLLASSNGKSIVNEMGNFYLSVQFQIAPNLETVGEPSLYNYNNSVFVMFNLVWYGFDFGNCNTLEWYLFNQLLLTYNLFYILLLLLFFIILPPNQKKVLHSNLSKKSAVWNQ